MAVSYKEVKTQWLKPDKPVPFPKEIWNLVEAGSVQYDSDFSNPSVGSGREGTSIVYGETKFETWRLPLGMQDLAVQLAASLGTYVIVEEESLVIKKSKYIAREKG